MLCGSEEHWSKGVIVKKIKEKSERQTKWWEVKFKDDSGQEMVLELKLQQLTVLAAENAPQ
jgi:hypothetical protein